VAHKIAVSILNADFRALAAEIAAAEAGGADLVHVDVMDGHFVPNLSLGPVIVDAVRACSRLPIDVHLMIERPERLLDPFVEAGANRLIIHQEATAHVHRAVQVIHSLGAQAGLALNPGTPVELAEPMLRDIEALLLMTVNPGFGGQQLIPSTVEKVAHARALIDAAGVEAELHVDGGVRLSNVHLLCNAGATVFVAGTSVFQEDGGPARNVERLRQALESPSRAAGKPS
jgi:ribulose-phosphate 3-epimerase